MVNPKKFLKRYSGKIVGVGDTFDLSRSSIVGETSKEYLDRTAEWWSHISDFVEGNHDSKFLQKFKDQLNPVKIYRKGPVLALHGHQLKFTFNQSLIIKSEKRWDTDISRSSLFWDIEEWFCAKFNKYFRVLGKKAYAQALSTLEEISKAGLLDDKVRIIITGHTHLPFRAKIKWKNKKYKVINCGSSLYGKKFSPVYIKEIDKWFVSDLHLGTAKSLLN